MQKNARLTPAQNQPFGGPFRPEGREGLLLAEPVLRPPRESWMIGIVRRGDCLFGVIVIY
jgi:hypothetical protein